MKPIGIALVALFVTFQLPAVQAQSVVYDIDVSGAGDVLELRVFGTLTVDLMTDQVQDSTLQFQTDGTAAEALFLTFNNDGVNGIVDFFETDGELFVIADTNSIGTLGPLWETSNQESSFEVFSGFVPEVGGVLLSTSRGGGDQVEFKAPSPQGFRLGQTAVPEPSAWVALGLGLISLISRRRQLA